MKVAFVGFNGIAEYCVRLATGIAHDRDTRVLLFLPNHEPDHYLHLLGSSVELQLFDQPRLRQPLKQLHMTTQLVRQITAFNPDVIHLQGGHFWFNFALPLLGDHPLVLTVHDVTKHVGERNRQPQWSFDSGCYRARERIVHAPQVKELLLQRLSIPSSTVHVIPHILIGDSSETVGANVRDEEPLVLFFGRIWEYKGLDYLIRAEPFITSQVPQARIAIAGQGEDFGRYRRMMIHPERFIIYNEYTSDEKRAELFRRASVVVLPYIEASQSGVIPIAYRFGKPVVATTVGGLPDMVDHGQTGYLVPPRDATALAESIVLLLQSKELRSRFGENGRRKVNTECAPERVGRMTRLVYHQAVKNSVVTRDAAPSHKPEPSHGEELS